MTRVLVLLAAAVLLDGGSASAKKRRAVAPPPPPAAAADGISPEAKAAAKEHYAVGEKFFAEGKFAEAKTEYEAAYSSWQLDGFLFNIAQCERNLGHTDSAIDFFERYLKTPKAARNRGEVEAVLVELHRKQDADKAAVVDAQAAEEARVAAATRAAEDAKAANEAKAVADAKAAAEQRAVAAAATVATPNPLLTPTPTPADNIPIYKKKSFWAAAAVAVVVVAGGATGIALGVNSSKLPPGGSLGVVDWR